jgi:putative acetyltransferase
MMVILQKNIIKTIPADTEERLRTAETLIKEYASSLGFDLSFQNFEKEMANFPDQYSPPQGCLLLAEYGTEIVGCAAFRDLGDGICEMKRLYVRPSFRKLNAGRVLVETIIHKARDMGYTRMRLDTIPEMKAAVRLYTSLGFKEIPPYRYNPIEGAKYLELVLQRFS